VCQRTLKEDLRDARTCGRHERRYACPRRGQIEAQCTCGAGPAEQLGDDAEQESGAISPSRGIEKTGFQSCRRSSIRPHTSKGRTARRLGAARLSSGSSEARGQHAPSRRSSPPCPASLGCQERGSLSGRPIEIWAPQGLQLKLGGFFPSLDIAASSQSSLTEPVYSQVRQAQATPACSLPDQTCPGSRSHLLDAAPSLGVPAPQHEEDCLPASAPRCTHCLLLHPLAHQCSSCSFHAPLLCSL
jgi:hypothetical protein